MDGNDADRKQERNTTMNKLIITLVVSALAICTFAQERGEGRRRGRPQERGGMEANPEAKLHRFSTTIEKERPELNQETKDLIGNKGAEHIDTSLLIQFQDFW